MNYSIWFHKAILIVSYSSSSNFFPVLSNLILYNVLVYDNALKPHWLFLLESTSSESKTY